MSARCLFSFLLQEPIPEVSQHLYVYPLILDYLLMELFWMRGVRQMSMYPDVSRIEATKVLNGLRCIFQMYLLLGHQYVWSVIAANMMTQQNLD